MNHCNHSLFLDIASPPPGPPALFCHASKINNLSYFQRLCRGGDITLRDASTRNEARNTPIRTCKTRAIRSRPVLLRTAGTRGWLIARSDGQAQVGVETNRNARDG